MTGKEQAPSLLRDDFNCSHCNVYAHQNFFNLSFAKDFDRSVPPFDECSNISRQKDFKIERLLDLDFYHSRKKGTLSLSNIGYASVCDHCKQVTLWVSDRIVYPEVSFHITLNPDLDEDIQKLFNEARVIYNQSPRGACALLRLCLQKLCKQLGEKGATINDDIKNLVKKGLSERLTKALDIVRVIGNEAVHPGQIDFDDNQEIAKSLFKLINLIADKMLTEPKEIDELHSTLPASHQAAIERRDKKNPT